MSFAFAKTWKFWAALVGVGLVIFFIAQLFSYFSRENQREEDANRNQGEQTERLRSNEEIVNAVEKANRPVTDADRNVVCSRFDRNRSANCP